MFTFKFGFIFFSALVLSGCFASKELVSNDYQGASNDAYTNYFSAVEDYWTLSDEESLNLFEAELAFIKYRTEGSYNANEAAKAAQFILKHKGDFFSEWFLANYYVGNKDWKSAAFYIKEAYFNPLKELARKVDETAYQNINELYHLSLEAGLIK